MKNKKGFTLVELVVVIAIIGVLAAILVPLMMGYVKKARLRSHNSNAKVVYNVLTGELGKLITEGREEEIDELEVDCRGANPDPDNDLTRGIYSGLASNSNNSGILYIGSFGEDEYGKWYFVHWIGEPGDTMVGQYPCPAHDIKKVPTWKTYKDYSE
ncbi:type II secretion system protein [uncultured Ruminococcus sp.]|uniref:type II secretion system protein n=1 Tax=uncultured Ruminococcus sp. TaxID=165186 RepID=UPI0025E60473|nr:type II secretion system protein [uncultured Ruminococcus sp.]